MSGSSRIRHLWLIALVVIGICGVESTALAGTLQGKLTDSLTGTPIPGASVHVLGTDRTTTTDRDGDWSFELPEGEYELTFEKRLGDELYQFRLVNQHVPQYKPADSWIATTYYMDRGVPRVERPRGAPVPRIDHPSARDRGPVDLRDLPRQKATLQPGQYTIPKSPPMKIRVARRQDHSTCRSSIVAIEEVPLEDYAKGVLHPEIGVFRSINNHIEVYKAFALAAKSYGLYFMLRYDSGNRRTVGSAKPPNGFTWFHIDDTPCNQRYSDKRSITTANKAANQMKGKLLVKKGAPNKLHKYEYAASCKEHGTRPEYQNKIVGDQSPAHACVGSWCGHDSCAGHQDNPNVPGQDRCLVRGICQWGSAEWAKGGKDYKWLIAHYQPNLEIRDLTGGNQPKTVTVSGYVHENKSDVMGSGISGASVQIKNGPSTTTDASGKFEFKGVKVSMGTIELTASKSGYETNSRSKKLVAGMTNWASIHLKPTSSPDPDTGTGMSDTGTGRGDTGATGVIGDAAPQVPDGGSNATGADAGGGTGQGKYGGLGPMITTSHGSQSGCGATGTHPRKMPSGRAILLVLATLGLIRFRRR